MRKPLAAQLPASASYAAQLPASASYSPPLREGCLVRVESDPKRTAKLVRQLDEGTAEVEWFSGVALRTRESVPLSRLSREVALPQTRCYATDGLQTSWRMGRVLR